MACRRLHVPCYLLCLAAISVLAQGCSQKAEQAPAQAQAALSFDSIREQDRAVIEHPAVTPEATAVKDKLLACAAREGIAAPGQSAEDALVAKFSDDAIGLFLVSLRLEALAKENAASAAAAAHDLRERFAGNPVGALAFDWELRLHKAQSEEAFLTACNEAIGATELSGRIATVALQRRWEYFRDRADDKRASLDALLFWSLYPEKTVKLSLVLPFTGVLERAGFSLEAELLNGSKAPGELARWLWEQSFDLCATPAMEGASGDDAADALYYRTAPAYDELLALGKSGGLSERKKALTLARCARLAAAAREDKAARGAVVMYAHAAEQIAQAPLSKAEAEYYLAIGNVLAESLRTAARQAEPVRREVKFKSKMGTQGASDDLGRAQGAFLSYCINAEETAEAAKKWVEEGISFFDEAADNASSLRIYEDFLAKFTEGPGVADMLRQFGDFQKKKLKSPQKAVECYQKAWAIAPQSEEGIEAILAAGQTLLEQDSNEEAYLAFQEVLAASTQDSHARQVARFGAALAEAGLGMENEALEHMVAISTDSPQGELAPAALYWVATKHVERREYENAQRVLLDMQQRYPNASETVRAKTLIQKLDAFMKTKS